MRREGSGDRSILHGWHPLALGLLNDCVAAVPFADNHVNCNKPDNDATGASSTLDEDAAAEVAAEFPLGRRRSDIHWL